jgi:hypothetical protein
VDAVGVVQMGSEGSMAYGQFEARVQLRVRTTDDKTIYSHTHMVRVGTGV